MNKTFLFLTRVTFKFLLLTAMGSVTFSSCKNGSRSVFNDKTGEDGDHLQHVTEQLVAPPMLPGFEQVDHNGPEVIDVTLVAQEKKVEVAPGDSIWAFTYNGTVPGPMIVAHQNDFIELTLKNPATNSQAHNIDFHAATGAMGAVGLLGAGAFLRYVPRYVPHLR